MQSLLSRVLVPANALAVLYVLVAALGQAGRLSLDHGETFAGWKMILVWFFLAALTALPFLGTIAYIKVGHMERWNERDRNVVTVTNVLVLIVGGVALFDLVMKERVDPLTAAALILSPVALGNCLHLFARKPEEQKHPFF